MDLQSVVDLGKQHAGAVALAFTWSGIVWVYFRQRIDWGKKQFNQLVNFSLNYLVGDELVMRTLLETHANQIWLNEVGVKKILRAAKRTTTNNPFIVLDKLIDMDFAYRAVLNVLSERFAAGFVAQALGAPVRRGEFLFAITFERHPSIRTFKLRILLVERSTLEKSFTAGAAAKVHLSHPVYSIRRQTLMQMHAFHERSKTTGAPALATIELVVPALA